MITYYYRNIKDDALQQLENFKVGSWVHVVNPEQSELTFLEKELDLDKGLLKDALDMYEVPRIEIEHGDVYIYTRYPFDDNDEVKTIPILFCIADKFIATLELIDMHSSFTKTGKRRLTV